jgi:hypothetical protein
MEVITVIAVITLAAHFLVAFVRAGSVAYRNYGRA